MRGSNRACISTLPTAALPVPVDAANGSVAGNLAASAPVNTCRSIPGRLQRAGPTADGHDIDKTAIGGGRHDQYLRMNPTFERSRYRGHKNWLHPYAG